MVCISLVSTVMSIVSIWFYFCLCYCSYSYKKLVGFCFIMFCFQKKKRQLMLYTECWFSHLAYWLFVFAILLLCFCLSKNVMPTTTSFKISELFIYCFVLKDIMVTEKTTKWWGMTRRGWVSLSSCTEPLRDMVCSALLDASHTFGCRHLLLQMFLLEQLLLCLIGSSTQCSYFHLSQRTWFPI